MRDFYRVQIDSVPRHWIEREDGWTCIRICGKLDFSEIGIIARISAILASKNNWDLRGFNL
jgi:hypothetical protein